MASSRQTELYFFRHGIAVERGTYADDGARPLTAQGRSRTKEVAQRLKSLSCRFDCCLTSPLIRACQTTEILLQVGLSDSIDILPELSPGGDLSAWLSWLAQWQRQHAVSRVALVGHEPDLSNWAQQLVTGQSSDRWTLKKAGIIGVQVPDAAEAIANSVLFWLAPPCLLV